MPLQFGRGAFIKLGEESTYGTIAGANIWIYCWFYGC